MAGTTIGGQRASKTNKQRYGEDFYSVIGRAGGEKSRGGGFAVTGLAKSAGRKGGQASKRKVGNEMTVRLKVKHTDTKREIPIDTSTNIKSTLWGKLFQNFRGKGR